MYLFMFSVHRRSLSSTRESSTDSRLEFRTTTESCENKQNCRGREQISYAERDLRTPQPERRMSAECDASPVIYKTPQNIGHSGGKMNWVVDCIVLQKYQITNIFFGALMLLIEWWEGH